MAQTGSTDGSGRDTARRTLVVIAIVAVALLLWQIADALLLIFIGVLPAILLRGLAKRLSALVPLPLGWSLGVVAFAFVGALAAAAILMGPHVSDQFNQLAETLPQSIEQLRSSLEETDWGRYVLSEVQADDGSPQIGGDLFTRVTGTASRALGIATNVVLIFFAAIFFAVDPDLYKRGILLLVPKHKTERMREVLNTSGNALWRWLMGRLVAMIFVGVAVTIGLLLLGVPLALVLGVIAGLLDFVPFIGPIVSAVPAILLALTLGPAQALYAALVYFIVQQIEGNLVTPIIQQREVSLPPVLVLFAVVAAGLVFGLLGIIVATPLVVVIMVFVKMLYAEDVLGKNVSVPGAA